MATINIKIVDVQGESVLVKYATENSQKPINDYDAVAYQPRTMGYTDVNSFIEGIKETLLAMAIQRDNIEQAQTTATYVLSEWVGTVQTHEVLNNLITSGQQNPEVII